MFQAPSSSQGMGAGLQSLTVTEDPWNSLLFSIDKLAFCSSLFNCSGLSPSSPLAQSICMPFLGDGLRWIWLIWFRAILPDEITSLSLSMLRQFPCPSSLSTAAPLDLDQQLSLAMPRAELPTTRAKMLSLVATGSSSLGRTLLRWFAQHWEAGLICTSGCAKPVKPRPRLLFILFSLRWCTSFGLNIPRFSTGDTVVSEHGHSLMVACHQIPKRGSTPATKDGKKSQVMVPAQLHSWSPREHKSNSVTDYMVFNTLSPSLLIVSLAAMKLKTTNVWNH